MNVISNKSSALIVLIGLVGSLLWTARDSLACSTILVGRKATSDSSVLMSSSCDGDIMGLIYVMPAQKYPRGTKLPMYWNLPRPRTHQEYMANLRKGYELVGYLPVEQTYRSIILASANVHSLAEELGFWKKGDPFVWHGVYGDPGSEYNSLREWRALSLAAPSLGLKVTGDPQADRCPFSVKPDNPLTVQKLISIMRDGYEGTEFDLTEHEAFNPGGRKSPLARPWGPTELFDLLKIKPKRALCTPTSGYVFVAQLRDWLPSSFGNCLWFAYGPAYTSCFAPIYAGVTDLPDAWDQGPDYTRIRRDQVPWNFRLVFTERPKETPPVPKGLNWDLWLGPAKERPYHPAYTPLIWHYWWDFDGGRLGNFGCHTLDTAVWALDLEHPSMVESSSTQLSKETTPLASTCHYRFGARGAQPSVDLFWYDGGIRPPRPDCLEPGRELPRNGGSLLVGDDGAILSGIWSASPRIIPEKEMRDYEQPKPTIPRSAGHHRDWINACKGGPPASSNFEYGARLTEIVLLGVASLRTATTIQWDGPNMKATNASQLDPVIHGHFRKGWEI